MEFDKKEIMEWEEKQAEINLVKVYGKLSYKIHRKRDGSKRHINNKRPKFWWVKECAKARKMYQKSFRRKMKQNIYHEGYYHIRARDYKTYGYLTW